MEDGWEIGFIDLADDRVRRLGILLVGMGGDAVLLQQAFEGDA